MEHAFFTEYGPLGVAIAGMLTMLTFFLRYIIGRDKSAADINNRLIETLQANTAALTSMNTELKQHVISEQVMLKDLSDAHADPNSLFSTHGIRDQLDRIESAVNGLASSSN